MVVVGTVCVIVGCEDLWLIDWGCRAERTRANPTALPKGIDLNSATALCAVPNFRRPLLSVEGEHILVRVGGYENKRHCSHKQSMCFSTWHTLKNTSVTVRSADHNSQGMKFTARLSGKSVLHEQVTVATHSQPPKRASLRVTLRVCCPLLWQCRDVASPCPWVYAKLAARWRERERLSIN